MSTTLLYHAFGIKGYQHISTKCRGGAQVALQHHLSARLSEIHPSGQFMCYNLQSYHLRSTLEVSAARGMSLFPANGTWERRAFSGIGGAVREHYLMGWRELWVRDDFFAGKNGRGQSWGCKTRGNLRECQTTAAATSGRLQKAPMSPESQAPDCQARRVNW